MRTGAARACEARKTARTRRRRNMELPVSSVRQDVAFVREQEPRAPLPDLVLQALVARLRRVRVESKGLAEQRLERLPVLCGAGDCLGVGHQRRDLLPLLQLARPGEVGPLLLQRGALGA